MMSSTRQQTAPIWSIPCIIASLTLLMGIVIAKAFVLEDAFIVFRSIRDFHEGFYFSALPDVRSQSFTSNLWTLLLLIGGYLSQSLPNVAVMLSLGCTLATSTLLLVYFFRRGRPDLAIAGILMLASSNSFTDYSTGGLENPLAHLLLSGFFVYLAHKPWRETDFFILSLIAGGLIANRYDQALMVLPALVAVFLTRRNWKHDALSGLLGFAPLWLWAGFAWFYYGSIFPDTYFAKMHTGVPVLDRANLAFLHNLRMMDLDFFGMSVMLLAIAAGVYQAVKILRVIKRERCLAVITSMNDDQRMTLSLVAGLIAYNLYFFYAGGDFMAGRFMSILILGSVWSVLFMLDQQRIAGKKLLSIGLLFASLCGLKSFVPHLFVPGFGVGSDDHIVRAMTFDYRLFAQDWYFIGQDHGKKDWRQLGFTKALAADQLPYPSVEADVSAGIIPYYAGPRHKLIDTLGLSDPLLSRLPCTVLGAAAHCIRNVPAGYIDYVKTGKLDGMDPDLATYVDALFRIKTMPLFSLERIKILIAFTLGHYQPARQAYIAKHPNDYYKPGEGKPMFQHAYGETILAPILGARPGEKTANPMHW